MRYFLSFPLRSKIFHTWYQFFIFRCWKIQRCGTIIIGKWQPKYSTPPSILHRKIFEKYLKNIRKVCYIYQCISHPMNVIKSSISKRKIMSDNSNAWLCIKKRCLQTPWSTCRFAILGIFSRAKVLPSSQITEMDSLHDCLYLPYHISTVLDSNHFARSFHVSFYISY